MNIKDLVPYLSDEQFSECLAGDVFIIPYNPYNNILPNRTAFRSYEVDLAKWMSNMGYRATIPTAKPIARRELILQKQFDLTNPLIIFLITIPHQIAIGAIAGFIVYFATKKKGPPIILVKLDKKGEIEACTDEKGNTISHAAVAEAVSKLQYAPPFSRPDMDLDLPVPIHLEHTSKVVGHGTIWQDEQGRLVGKVRIEDGDTWNRIQLEELVGFSIGGIAKEYVCSICNKDYFACKHIKGQEYNGKEAFGIIKALDLAEISIVSDPTNIDCSIKEIDVRRI